MNLFYPAHEEILKAFLDQNVIFLLIGGYAVNYYGYNRTTGDMDLWLKPDNGNKEKMLSALSDLGFDDEGITLIRGCDFSQPQKFVIGNKNQPDRIEFMTKITGSTFDDAWSRCEWAELDGLQIPFIHFRDLIQNKKSAGRPQDLADVDYLEKIHRLKKKE